MVSYEPLYRTLKLRGESTYSLIHKYGINPRTVNNLKHNRGITTYTLEKLCYILSCTPNDILEFINDVEIQK